MDPHEDLSDDLEASLRSLRRASPAPELRQRTLAAAAAALETAAAAAPKPRGFFGELALASAAILYFLLPSAAAERPAGSAAAAATRAAALEQELGLDPHLGLYLARPLSGSSPGRSASALPHPAIPETL